MNPKVDQFLRRAPKWQAEMNALRTVVLGCGLNEEFKWGKPCYTFREANVAVMVPFRDHCALIFAKGALLQDPKGLLVQPTANTQAARQFRFRGLDEVTRQTKALEKFLKEAITMEETGQKVLYRTTAEFPIPDELRLRFRADPELQKAFEALTPGRQRGYLLHFAGAKLPKTREARIARCRDRILAGMGLQDGTI